MALTDKVLDKAVDVVTPADSKKDDYDLIIQQLFANNPNALKQLSNPAVKRALMASIGDAFVKGNEEVLKKIIPEILSKTNLAQIDLRQADATKRIEAEAERAKQIYAAYLAKETADAEVAKKRADASVNANTAGFLKYDTAAGGWAGLLRAVKAVWQAISTGSWGPIDQLISEVNKPKSFDVHAEGVAAAREAPANVYKSTNPTMVGAASPQDLARAMVDPNPMGALTEGQTPAVPGDKPAAKPGQHAATADHEPLTRKRQTGGTGQLIHENGASVTGDAAQQKPQVKKPALLFGDPALEYK